MINFIGKRLRVTIRQVETFVAVARFNSTRAASEVLSRSQSAVSASLAELEGHLGLELFDRLGKHLSLNDYGKRLLPVASDYLESASRLETLFQTEPPWALRIGASYTVGEHVLPHYLGQWRMKWPESHIVMHIANTENIINALLNLEIDIGFIEGAATHPDVRLDHWFDDELVIFCSPEHPLANKKVSLSKLRKTEWILRESGSGTREASNRMLIAALGQIDIAQELGSNEAIKNTVAVTSAMGCLSIRSVNEDFRNGTLAPIHCKMTNMRRPFSIAVHRHRKLPQASQAFIEECQTTKENSMQ